MSHTCMTHYMTHLLTNTSSLQIDLNQICKLRNQVAKNQVVKIKWQNQVAILSGKHVLVTCQSRDPR